MVGSVVYSNFAEVLAMILDKIRFGLRIIMEYHSSFLASMFRLEVTNGFFLR